MAENSKKFRILLPLLSGLLSVIFVLSGAIYIFFNINFLGNKEIQILKASEGPIKEKPKNSGGKIIDHQDADFYGILDKDIDNKVVEVLKPTAPEPELPSIELELDNNSEKDNISDNKNKKNKNETSDDNQDENLSNNIQDLEIASQEKENINTENKNVVNMNNYNQDNISEIIEKPVSKPKKGYFVQLASFNNETKAKVSVDVLNEKLAVSLSGNELQIMRVDLGDGKGIWWRIVTNIIPRGEAETVCALLKSEGNNCIVRSR